MILCFEEDKHNLEIYVRLPFCLKCGDVIVYFQISIVTDNYYNSRNIEIYKQSMPYNTNTNNILIPQ